MYLGSKTKQLEPSLNMFTEKLIEHYTHEYKFYTKQGKQKECDDKWKQLKEILAKKV